MNVLVPLTNVTAGVGQSATPKSDSPKGEGFGTVFEDAQDQPPEAQTPEVADAASVENKDIADMKASTDAVSDTPDKTVMTKSEKSDTYMHFGSDVRREWGQSPDPDVTDPLPMPVAPDEGTPGHTSGQLGEETYARQVPASTGQAEPELVEDQTDILPMRKVTSDTPERSHYGMPNLGRQVGEVVPFADDSDPAPGRTGALVRTDHSKSVEEPRVGSMAQDARLNAKAMTGSMEKVQRSDLNDFGEKTTLALQQGKEPEKRSLNASTFDQAPRKTDPTQSREPGRSTVAHGETRSTVMPPVEVDQTTHSMRHQDEVDDQAVRDVIAGKEASKSNLPAPVSQILKPEVPTSDGKDRRHEVRTMRFDAPGDAPPAPPRVHRAVAATPIASGFVDAAVAHRGAKENAAQSDIRAIEPFKEMTFELRTTTSPTQTTAAQTAHRPEMPLHVGRQLAEALTRQPERPVEIALNPAELGRVRMSLSASDVGIVVNILAERAETLDLMRRNIEDLGRAFSELGYESINFAFAEGQSGTGQDADTDDRDDGYNQPVPRLILDADGDAADPQPHRANPTPVLAGLDLRL